MKNRTSQPLHIRDLISQAMPFYAIHNAQEGDPVRSAERVPYSSSPVLPSSDPNKPEFQSPGHPVVDFGVKRAGFHRIANATETGFPSGDALDNNVAAA